MKYSQYMIGWLSLLIAGLNIVCNIGAMTISSLKSLSLKYKAYQARKARKAQFVEVKEIKRKKSKKTVKFVPVQPSEPCEPFDDMTEREKAIRELEKDPFIGYTGIIERERAIRELQQDPLIGDMKILEREAAIHELYKDPFIGNMGILEREAAIAELKKDPFIGPDFHCGDTPKATLNKDNLLVIPQLSPEEEKRQAVKELMEDSFIRDFELEESDAEAQKLEEEEKESLGDFYKVKNSPKVMKRAKTNT